MSCYQCGRATIGTVSVCDARVLRAKFVSIRRPYGCEVDAPAGFGPTHIDVRMSRGRRVGLRIYKLNIGDFDLDAQSEIELRLQTGEGDDRAILLGDAELVVEGAVHKQTQGGGDATEYFWIVKAQDDPARPHLARALLDKRPLVLCAIETAEALPVEEEKEKKSKDGKAKPDSRQVDIMELLERPGTAPDPVDDVALMATAHQRAADETANLDPERQALIARKARCPHCEFVVDPHEMAAAAVRGDDVWHATCWSSLSPAAQAQHATPATSETDGDDDKDDPRPGKYHQPAPSMADRAAGTNRRGKKAAQAPAPTSAEAGPAFVMVDRSDGEKAEAWIERSLLAHGSPVMVTRIAAAVHAVDKRLTIGVVRRLIDNSPGTLTARIDGTVVPAILAREKAGEAA